MNSPQTLGQIIGLTLQVLFDEIDYENNFEVSSSYEEPHTPPYSSAVSDPSHSPIERGQRHGTRGSVCSEWWLVWKLGRNEEEKD